VELTRLRRGRSGYPPLLEQLYDPPAELYVRGDVEILGEAAVAIVGARSCSPYGTQVARSLARELAGAGLVVVSGLARGIDGEAHRGTLEAGGRTVAVLGCGIDRDYPRSHAQLALRIREQGAVVSEYPPGIEPAPWRFPARNRKQLRMMPLWLNHAVHTCCRGRQMPCPCGPGVVSDQARLGRLRGRSQEREQGSEQEPRNLMLASVVMPVGEGLGRRGLTAGIAPRQGETDKEQQPNERSGKRQKALETIHSHAIPLSLGSATLLGTSERGSGHPMSRAAAALP
jgi:hypothetical protein